MNRQSRKPPRLRVPLHISILTLFLTLFAVLLGGLVVFQHRQSTRIALADASADFASTATTVVGDLVDAYRPIAAIVDITARLPELRRPPGDGQTLPYDYMLTLMRLAPRMSMLYIGYGDGGSAGVVRLGPEGDNLPKDFAPPPGAHYAIQVITVAADGRRRMIMRYLDDDQVEIGRRDDLDPDFDPRTRPWYQLAHDSDTVVRTPLYRYLYNLAGVTFARRLPGPVEGVVAADIGLSGISNVLDDLRVTPGTRLLLFNAEGGLIAHAGSRITALPKPDEATGGLQLARVEDLADPVLSAAYEQYRRAPKRREIAFAARGRQYIGGLFPLPADIGPEEYLSIITPLDELTATADAIREQGILLSLGLVLLAAPLIMIAARRIAKPLQMLADEAQRIRRFQLDGRIDQSSIILEVWRLAEAMTRMKDALRDFARYVPAQLVERIVASGEVPALGGERRELTVMFSDIADFTPLAEALEPEALMRQTSVYFTELGAAVVAEGGTIDKYIGDALMAFWNAPDAQEDHVARACRAALAIKARTEALNARFAAEGAPLMATRIGLHAGEAVVGNVGSIDRMNYTALGETVNLAARLEGLNKEFGTTILVSQAVRDAAGPAFVFQPVGLASPKGVSRPIPVYELQGVE